MNTLALRYGKGKLGTLTDILNSANNYVTQGSTLIKNVQNTVSSLNPPSSSTPSPASLTTPTTGNNTINPTINPPANTGLSTGAKIGIGVGAVAVLGTIVFVATRKTKK